MKKIIHKIIIIGFWSGVVLAAGIGIYTSIIYFDWRDRQDQVLEKLFTYKKQLDYLRKPVPSEGSMGRITIGAVAIPSKVYDRNQKLIGEFYIERRTLIPIEKMPPYLPKALVASEDRRFYEHGGVSYRAITRAMLTNLVRLRYAQGGSTITQQLAKVLFTEQEKTMRRKVFELFCTFAIEKRFTKKEILEMYLNLIFMGHSNYGIESASHYYFNKPATKLTLPETAMLIGILPSPNRFSPVNDLSEALLRQALVLNAMKEMGYTEEKKVKRELKSFHKTWDIYKIDSKYNSDIGAYSTGSLRVNKAPFFLDYIKSKLLKKYGYSSEEILKGGLRIYTTLDYEKQQRAAIALKRGIEKQREKYRAMMKSAKSKKKKIYAQARRKTNGVFITLHPQSGHILTMIGGAEYSSKNLFNRSVNSYRQIGSLMKPFVYYTALEKRLITPAAMLKDKKTVYGKYKFNNYDYKFLGEITAYEALRKSRNTVAVRLFKEIGFGALLELFESILDTPSGQFGSDERQNQNIKKRIPRELGVALGAVEFSPLEVAQAYATLLNDGYRVEPEFILKIEDASGKLLWSAPRQVKKYRILDPDAAYITVSMLEGALKKGGTAGWIERYRTANPDLYWPPMAGKTGTTSDHKDVWFAGLTPEEISIVWIGTDYNTSLGRKATGGGMAAPVWIDYISGARTPPQNSRPVSFAGNYTLGVITRESFCPKSGGVPLEQESCPHALVDFPFIRGEEPDFFCPLHKPAAPEPEPQTKTETEKTPPDASSENADAPVKEPEESPEKTSEETSQETPETQKNSAAPSKESTTPPEQ